MQFINQKRESITSFKGFSFYDFEIAYLDLKVKGYKQRNAGLRKLCSNSCTYNSDVGIRKINKFLKEGLITQKECLTLMCLIKVKSRYLSQPIKIGMREKPTSDKRTSCKNDYK